MTLAENLIADYGLYAMLFVIFLEYACFPVSSEIILPLAGLTAAKTGIPFPFLVITSTAAGLLGTTITYLIGRFGGSPLLEKIMHRFPSTEKPVLSSYRFFGNHEKSASFFSRLLPLCRTYIGFVAGVVKQSLLNYWIFSGLGILLWNTVLTGLGYYFYPYRQPFFDFFAKYKHWIFIIGIFLLFFFLLQKKPKDAKYNE